MSTPAVIKLLPGRIRITRRAGAPIRAVITVLFGSDLSDPVREPEGLQHPMSARARRLMRSGRVSGW